MRRHRFDPISAIFGSVFLAAGVSALIEGDRWSLLDSGRLWAVLLFLGGIAVLVAAFRRDDGPTPDGAAPPPPPVRAESRPLTDNERAIEELRAEVRDQTGPATRADAEPIDDSSRVGATRAASGGDDPPAGQRGDDASDGADTVETPPDEVNLDEPSSDDHV